MNSTIIVDWKFAAAIGAAAVATILATKMDAAAAEKLSENFIDSCKELAIALKSNC